MPWTQIHNFVDPLQCQIVGTDLEIFPTSKGAFKFEVMQLRLDRLGLGDYRVKLPQVGTLAVKPGRRTINFLAESSPILQWCGGEVLAGDIVVSDADPVHLRSNANHHGGSMSLPNDEFDAATQAVVGLDLSKKFQGQVIRPSPTLMSRLLKLHKIITQLAHDAPDILEQPQVRRALEEQAIHVMIRCIANGVSAETSIGQRRHGAIIARFRDFLEENPDQSLYLTDICAGIGVAERTLRACCEEHLGMGPVRYLALRRMYLVRRALLAAEGSKTSVTRVATDHGFWELGRFSVAYRRLFGESPSETLRRPQIQTKLSPPLVPLARGQLH